MTLKVYSEQECLAKLTADKRDGWYMENGWLRKKYTTSGWPVTLMAVNAIGYLCEAADHHADLAVSWGKIWVKLQTHSSSGITDKDWELAAKIDEVVLWKPADGALAPGIQDKFVAG
jgi:4a-hydroxytetrahydrobiopterin dehydratase